MPRQLSALAIAHAKDPRCHWCSRPTQLGGPARPEQATRDHIHPRKKSNGAKLGRARVASDWVLACYECNHDRGNTPVAEWLRRLPKYLAQRPPVLGPAYDPRKWERRVSEVATQIWSE